jgi:hypothetical protein
MNSWVNRNLAAKGTGSRLGAVLLALCLGAAAHPQAAVPPSSGSGPDLCGVAVSPAFDPEKSRMEGRIIREIGDPGTGRRWLLRLDEGHPGGPGRLVEVAEPNSPERARPGRAAMTGTGRAEEAGPAAHRLVIRAGDRLVVEEHTAVVEARLEAVALSPAAEGSEFDARLAIGGKVVRAVASSPGHAMLRARAGRRP